MDPLDFTADSIYQARALKAAKKILTAMNFYNPDDNLDKYYSCDKFSFNGYGHDGGSCSYHVSSSGVTGATKEDVLCDLQIIQQILDYLSRTYDVGIFILETRNGWEEWPCYILTERSKHFQDLPEATQERLRNRELISDLKRG